jgi:hypothetical protein
VKAESSISIRPALPGRRTLEVRLTVTVQERRPNEEMLSFKVWDALKRIANWDEIYGGAGEPNQEHHVPLKDGRIAVVTIDWDNWYGTVRDTEVLR